MAAVFLATAVLLVAAAAAGQGLRALCGLRDWAWWAPAAGFAVLLAVAGTAIRVPGHATTAAVVTGLLAAAALTARRVREPLARALPEGLPLAIAVAVLGALPYLVSGRAGIPGAGNNNDMSAHLATAWWLDAHQGPAPVAALGGPLATQGYPVGPHALAAATSRALGVDLVHAFDAVQLVVPVLLALAALAALPAANRAARSVAAALVGLCYLTASYLVQAAFKETMEGLLLIAFALALRDLLRSDRRPKLSHGIPLGAIAAGAVYEYSYPGLLWLGAAAAATLALHVLAHRPRPTAALRAALPAAFGAAAGLAVIAAPEANRMITFADSLFANEPPEGHGNLVHAISPLQALGIWLTPDFRFDPGVYPLTLAGAAVAGVALLYALTRWAARRDFALIGALLAAFAVWLYLDEERNIYNAAKGLAVLGPVVAITIAGPLLAAWRERGGRGRVPIRAASVVVLAGAAVSSFLAVRDGPVAAPSHGDQLAALRPLVQGHSVLFLDLDDFAQWQLRGTRLSTGPLLYSPHQVRPWPRKPYAPPQELDFDSFSSRTLAGFDFVVTPAGAYQSTPPPAFRAVRRTPDYTLWRRTGPVAPRRPYELTGAATGAVMDCAARPRHGTAVTRPAPIVGAAAGWHGRADEAGETATLTLPHVPAGRWDVSLQYVSSTGLTLDAPGLHARLPATLDRMGPYWPAGTLTQRRAGRLTIRVTARQTSWLGRILGAPGRTRALLSPGGAPLRDVALSRHGAPPATAPARSACGRWVDWTRAG